MRTAAPCLTLMFSVLLMAGPLRAQVSTPLVPEGSSNNASLLEDQRAARQLLERAAAAHGGTKRILDLTSLRVTFAGESHATTQSPTPAPPFNKHPWTSHVSYDLAGQRIYEDETTQWPNFTRRDQVKVIGGTAHYVNPVGGVSSDPAAGFAELSRVTSRFPLTALRAALMNPASLRVEAGGVGFTLPDGSRARLQLDPRTQRIAALESLGDDYLRGDSVVSVEFTDYAETSGLTVPRQVRQLRAGVEQWTARLTTELQPRFDEQTFAAPAAAATAEPWKGEGEAPKEVLSIERFGEHVAVLHGIQDSGYNVLVAELGDALLLFEAPLNAKIARTAVTKARELFGDKPVRYLVSSHHHDDHSGGVREAAKDGVTVLVGASNQAAYREMITAQRTITDPAHPRVAEARVEAISGAPRVFGAGDRAVQVIALDSNTHAEGMLFVYVPSQKLVFQADCLRFEPLDDQLRDAAVKLARQIQRMQLDVTSVASVHGPTGPFSEVVKRLGDRH